MIHQDGVRAVWVGRFQPVHLGHLEVLSRSLATLDMPHVAVLPFGLDRSQMEPQSDYKRHLADAYLVDLNPLTVWERFALMRLALLELDAPNRVAILVAPHHESQPNVVEDFFPPRRLICVTNKDAFERAKAEYWRERGEEVFVLELPFPILSNTEIRQRVRAGDDWRSFLPATTHDYFLDIDGPRRVYGTT